ncbi:LysR family transcriptional regulator [Camelimonas abortus]|uniref:LysR family transcriptional regulator n=1 Tax=Camelimonas abortus TaxID=1017184 RepID=A0ABV7LC97_9HYPH
MKFDWDDLRYFLAVARAGRLTVAARRLGADHATVSRRVTALESALKAKLFERRPHGYQLTAQGERLLAKAEAIETQALAAQSEIGGADLTLSGAVRLGAPDGLGSTFLAPRIVALAARYPELEIQLVAMSRIPSLSKREADIAISLNPPREGRIVARRLGDYDLALYAAPEYLAAAPPVRTVADLFRHRIVGYIDDLIYAPELDYLDEVAKGLRPRIQSSSIMAQLAATEAGAGVCVLPRFMTGGRRLQRVLPGEVKLTRSFWLVVHADLREVARIRAVMDFLVREIRAARDVLQPPEP